ncbi:MAG: T9SS type A sorting domain-containing protein, partial [Bacteroidales bacterium]|nr:T9SS type A sorting domain-containing protein [Bacteroidales bacterium]
VMAKGVLCFFHGICYEDDSLVDDNADNNAGTRAKRVTTDITDDAALTVYPNPTDDLLFVELRGAEIACIALYDLQGRMVTGTGPHAGAPQPGTTATMNLRNVPAGVYLLRVTAADGKEYHRKIVKR